MAADINGRASRGFDLSRWELNRRDLLRITGLGLAAVGVSPIIAACGESSSVQPGSKKKTLTIGIFQNPETLDPGVTNETAIGQIAFAFGDPLVWTLSVNGVTRQYPGLAEKWEVSADATQYTFHLRKGATFHDGTPVNAQAVKATFEHINDPKSKAIHGKTRLGPYQETVVVDDYTARVVFTKSNAAFNSAMSASDFVILSPTALAKYGADFGKNPVGSGAFIFKEFVDGDHVLLTRNPNYAWGPAPLGNGRPASLEQLKFRVLTDATAQRSALLAGEIDVAESLNPQDIADLSGQTGKYKRATVYPLGEPYSFIFNASKAPFDDARVRQAFAQAVDIEQMIQTLFRGVYKRSKSVVQPSTQGFAASQDIIKYDVTGAQQLLDQAGWPKGSDGIRRKGGVPLTLTLINLTGYGFDDASQYAQAQWKQALGANVSVSSQAYPAVGQTYNQGKFDIGDSRLAAVDAHDTYGTLWAASQIQNGFNWSHFSNPANDALVEKANATGDEKARLALYQQAFDTVAKAYVHMPLFQLQTDVIGPASMNGLVFQALTGHPLFHGVTA